METKALIDFLTQNAGPAPKVAVSKNLTLMVLGGALGATAISLIAWQPQPLALFATPTPWAKLVYALLMIVSSAWLMLRLSRPVARIKLPQLVVAGALLVMLCVSTISLLLLPVEERNVALSNGMWLHCASDVFLISLPSTAFLFWFMRKLAPTQLRIAGATAGLLAGAIGSAVYTFSCPEIATTGVLWYTLGMASSALLGFLLGPRLLRW